MLTTSKSKANLSSKNTSSIVDYCVEQFDQTLYKEAAIIVDTFTAMTTALNSNSSYPKYNELLELMESAQKNQFKIDSKLFLDAAREAYQEILKQLKMVKLTEKLAVLIANVAICNTSLMQNNLIAARYQNLKAEDNTEQDPFIKALEKMDRDKATPETLKKQISGFHISNRELIKLRKLQNIADKFKTSPEKLTEFKKMAHTFIPSYLLIEIKLQTEKLNHFISLKEPELLEKNVRHPLVLKKWDECKKETEETETPWKNFFKDSATQKVNTFFNLINTQFANFIALLNQNQKLQAIDEQMSAFKENAALFVDPISTNAKYEALTAIYTNILQLINTQLKAILSLSYTNKNFSLGLCRDNLNAEIAHFEKVASCLLPLLEKSENSFNVIVTRPRSDAKFFKQNEFSNKENRSFAANEMNFTPK